MTDELKRKLRQPFDDYEVQLLELVAIAQMEVHDWAKRAQQEYETDTDALHSYVEHMAAISRARAYNNALFWYRQFKKPTRVVLPSPQIDQNEELALV